MLEDQLISLGILFFCSIVGGIIATKLKQPPVIGLLLIGAMIGPYSLNLVNNHELIEMITEFGAVLLLFVIGLEFVIPKLIKIGFKAFIFGLMKTGTLLFIIYQISLLLGLSRTSALIFGVMFSLSSTVVIVKVLESKGLYNRQEVPLLIGILIIEDLLGVIALTFLNGVNGNTSMLLIIEKLVISITLLILAYIVILKLAKKAVNWVLKTENDEIVTFLSLGICTLFSYFAYFLGLSAATGAFLAGSIVASLPQVKEFEHAIKPYTLVFSSLFFLAIGTMTNMSVLKENMMMLIVILLSVVIVCFITVSAVSYLFANFKRQQVIFSSIAMIPIGEFSLLIAKSAMNLDLGVDFVSIAAFIIFSSAIVMSLLINYFEPMTNYLVNSTSNNFKYKPRSFAQFMRLLSDELDSENSNSNKFKLVAVKSMSYFIFLLFSLIALRRVVSFAAGNAILKYSLIGALVLVIAYLTLRLFFSIRESMKSLANIIGMSYFSGDVKRGRYLLKKLLIALALLLITLYSPVIEILLKIPMWINGVSLMLLMIVGISFKKLFNYTYKFSTKKSTKVRKVNYDDFNFIKEKAYY